MEPLEGDNLRYINPSQDQKSAILDFLLNHFAKEESLNHAISITPQDIQPHLEDALEECVGSPVSFIALNEEGEIVGCRLSSIVDLDEKRAAAKPEEPDLSPNNSRYTEETRKLEKFLNALEDGYPELLKDYHKALKFFIVNVRKDYCRRGIAEKLVQVTEARAKEMGCDVVMVTATGFKSQALFEKKLGYQTLRVFHHSEWLDEDGKQVFPCNDGTVCGKLMYKEL